MITDPPDLLYPCYSGKFEERRRREYFPNVKRFHGYISRSWRRASQARKEWTSSLLSEFSNIRKSTINYVKYQSYFLSNSSASLYPRRFTTTSSARMKEGSPETEWKRGENLSGFSKPNSKGFDEMLTHIDRDGELCMVDVGRKVETHRYSIASGTVNLGEKAFGLVKDSKLKKGDVLSVAKLAGIMAAKQTPNLIPLCHSISLTNIKVDVILEEETFAVRIVARVDCTGRTGVEMEALTAVSVAALTVYDMCKSVSKNIIITDIRLEEKDGGKSGLFVHKTS